MSGSSTMIETNTSVKNHRFLKRSEQPTTLQVIANEKNGSGGVYVFCDSSYSTYGNANEVLRGHMRDVRRIDGTCKLFAWSTYCAPIKNPDELCPNGGTDPSCIITSIDKRRCHMVLLTTDGEVTDLEKFPRDLKSGMPCIPIVCLGVVLNAHDADKTHRFFGTVFPMTAYGRDYIYFVQFPGDPNVYIVEISEPLLRLPAFAHLANQIRSLEPTSSFKLNAPKMTFDEMMRIMYSVPFIPGLTDEQVAVTLPVDKSSDNPTGLCTYTMSIVDLCTVKTEGMSLLELMALWTSIHMIDPAVHSMFDTNLRKKYQKFLNKLKIAFRTVFMSKKQMMECLTSINTASVQNVFVGLYNVPNTMGGFTAMLNEIEIAIDTVIQRCCDDAVVTSMKDLRKKAGTSSNRICALPTMAVNPKLKSLIGMKPASDARASCTKCGKMVTLLTAVVTCLDACATKADDPSADSDEDSSADSDEDSPKGTQKPGVGQIPTTDADLRIPLFTARVIGSGVLESMLCDECLNELIKKLGNDGALNEHMFVPMNRSLFHNDKNFYDSDSTARNYNNLKLILNWIRFTMAQSTLISKDQSLLAYLGLLLGVLSNTTDSDAQNMLHISIKQVLLNSGLHRYWDCDIPAKDQIASGQRVTLGRAVFDALTGDDDRNSAVSVRNNVLLKGASHACLLLELADYLGIWCPDPDAITNIIRDFARDVLLLLIAELNCKVRIAKCEVIAKMTYPLIPGVPDLRTFRYITVDDFLDLLEMMLGARDVGFYKKRLSKYLDSPFCTNVLASLSAHASTPNMKVGEMFASLKKHMCGSPMTILDYMPNHNEHVIPRAVIYYGLVPLTKHHILPGGNCVIRVGATVGQIAIGPCAASCRDCGFAADIGETTLGTLLRVAGTPEKIAQVWNNASAVLIAEFLEFITTTNKTHFKKVYGGDIPTTGTGHTNTSYKTHEVMCDYVNTNISTTPNKSGQKARYIDTSDAVINALVEKVVRCSDGHISDNTLKYARVMVHHWIKLWKAKKISAKSPYSLKAGVYALFSRIVGLKPCTETVLRLIKELKTGERDYEIETLCWDYAEYPSFLNCPDEYKRAAKQLRNVLCYIDKNGNHPLIESVPKAMTECIDDTFVKVNVNYPVPTIADVEDVEDVADVADVADVEDVTDVADVADVKDAEDSDEFNNFTVPYINDMPTLTFGIPNMHKKKSTKEQRVAAAAAAAKSKSNSRSGITGRRT